MIKDTNGNKLRVGDCIDIQFWDSQHRYDAMVTAKTFEQLYNAGLKMVGKLKEINQYDLAMKYSEMLAKIVSETIYASYSGDNIQPFTGDSINFNAKGENK